MRAAVATHGAATVAIVRRDLAVYLSYRFRLLSQVATAFFAVTLFYYVSRMVTVDSFADADAYFAYVVVGLIILQVIQSAVGLPSTLRQELYAGTFERIVLSPFGAVWGSIAMCVFPFLRATAVALISLALAGLVYGLPIEWDTALLAVPVAALGAACFCAFGLLFAALMLLARQALAGVGWVMAGMSLVAGFYFPPELLPAWVRWMSDVQPFTPMIDLLRNVLVGTPLDDPAMLLVAKLAAFAVVLVPLSVWALHRAIRFGRTRGTIIEV